VSFFSASSLASKTISAPNQCVSITDDRDSSGRILPVNTKLWRRQPFGGAQTGALGEPSGGNGADPRDWSWIPVETFCLFRRLMKGLPA
jgi:hypothetical protein